MPKARKAISASLSLNPGPGAPQKQTIEIVQKIVATMLGRAGCERCGRLAYLDFKFLGDPGPDLERLGGISLDIREG